MLSFYSTDVLAFSSVEHGALLLEPSVHNKDNTEIRMKQNFKCLCSPMVYIDEVGERKNEVTVVGVESA
mgnify:CR=1 FL=1